MKCYYLYFVHYKTGLTRVKYSAHSLCGSDKNFNIPITNWGEFSALRALFATPLIHICAAIKVLLLLGIPRQKQSTVEVVISVGPFLEHRTHNRTHTAVIPRLHTGLDKFISEMNSSQRSFIPNPPSILLFFYRCQTCIMLNTIFLSLPCLSQVFLQYISCTFNPICS